jgi:p-methyltransferase
MPAASSLDCVVVGYNDPPFEVYERLLRQYGEDSEAYRDLRFSFVELDGRKLSYVDLLNHASSLAGNGKGYISGEIPNLAAAYLTGFLRRQGLLTEYINLFQSEKERLIEYLDRDPVCVAITTTFYVMNFLVYEMVEFIRRQDSRVKS